MEMYPFRAAPVENYVDLLLGQAVEGNFRRDAEMLAHCVEKLHVVPVRRPIPGHDRSIAHRLPPVRYDEIRVKLHVHAQTVTCLASAERVVERKQPGLKFGKVYAAVRTRQGLGED